MAHAYTPGLRVSNCSILRKERRLPLPGEVKVSVGDVVQADTVVAATNLPGNVEPVNMANKLGILPIDIREFMLKSEGQAIKKEEPIAFKKSFFGLFKTIAKSPVDGSVESISQVTGQVLLREPPIPVELKAYVDGRILEVIPNEGVIVETIGAFIQGIFGIGEETFGALKLAVSDPDEILDDKKINNDFIGSIIIGGSLVTSKAVQKAIEVKAKGIIAGGFNDQDLREFLGYDLGVAITGHEEKGITLVITEGFGQISMAPGTFNLLAQHEGKKACMNGATQIRAGVIRPEVIIPLLELIDQKMVKVEEFGKGLEVGTLIRVIRQPYFGRLGKVSALPIALQKLEMESMVRVLEVEFEDGKKAILPRANVEMIEY